MIIFAEQNPFKLIRFLNPPYLFALSLILIPVLIHLFNFRKFKKAYFTNVRFLQELKEETSRLSRLKHLLVLASRILAVAFLVLAFAQPIIPLSKAAPKSLKRSVSIYIDNSFSMEGITRDGLLLTIAQRKAREIALAFPPSTRFQLLTNDFDAVQQRLLSREDFLDELDQVKISPVSRMLSEVVSRQGEALNQAGTDSKESFLISDFQVSTANIADVKADSTISINIVSLPVQPGSNIYIDSCWLETPVVQLNHALNLFVRLKNSGEKDADMVPVKLLLNGNQRAVAGIPVPAGQTVTATLNFSVNTPGWQSAEIQITDHPITFDDQYFLSFEVKEKLKVMSIFGHQPGPYLQALFGKDPYFQFAESSASQVDYSILPTMDMVILDEIPELSTGLSAEVRKYLEAGGSVVLFPDSNSQLPSYSSFLNGDLLTTPVAANLKVEKIDLRHPLFSDVFDNSRKNDGSIDYPITLKHFPITKSGNGRLVLMELEGGDPLLAEYKFAKGLIYLFTVPLNPGFSNLSRHAMIVPILYKMAILSIKQPDFSYTLGRELPVELDRISIGSDETFHLQNKQLNIDLIPSHKVMPGGIIINTGGQIKQAGVYEVKTNKNMVAVLAFNYDRKESDLSCLSADAIKEQAASARIREFQFFKPDATDLTKTLNQIAEGISLWKYCILLALLFLLIETLLLRFWKTT